MNTETTLRPASSTEKEALAHRQRLDHPLIQDLLLNPRRWRIWPAIAAIRWVSRHAKKNMRRIVYRSKPALEFATSEIEDVGVDQGGVEVTLAAPGIAAGGSPLPTSDIARIIEDRRRGGALALWLDGPCDRLMHALEAAHTSNSAAFALARGEQVDAWRMMVNLAGRSAPLAAGVGGVLADTWERPAAGAVGLTALFVGAISAAGLAELLQAYTGLPVEVTEFAGAVVEVLRPLEVGATFGAVLGRTCPCPAAGAEVTLEGGSRADAQRWAADPQRRASLSFLVLTYLGTPLPRVRLFLRLDVDNVPPAAAHAGTALGGLAVLGTPSRPVRLPLGETGCAVENRSGRPEAERLAGISGLDAWTRRPLAA